MESAKNFLQLTDTNSEVSNQEKAFLLHGTDKIPIYAENTSKYSLSFYRNSFILIQLQGVSLFVSICLELIQPMAPFLYVFIRQIFVIGRAGGVYVP